jgi:hypothetical protein
MPGRDDDNINQLWPEAWNRHRLSKHVSAWHAMQQHRVWKKQDCVVPSAVADYGPSGTRAR